MDLSQFVADSLNFLTDYLIILYFLAVVIPLLLVYGFGLFCIWISSKFSKESPIRPTVYEDFFNQSDGVNSSAIFNIDESIFDHSPISNDHSPISNMDGSMMVGSLDVHGNLYGVASS